MRSSLSLIRAVVVGAQESALASRSRCNLPVACLDAFNTIPSKASNHLSASVLNHLWINATNQQASTGDQSITRVPTWGWRSFSSQSGGSSGLGSDANDPGQQIKMSLGDALVKLVGSHFTYVYVLKFHSPQVQLFFQCLQTGAQYAGICSRQITLIMILIGHQQQSTHIERNQGSMVLEFVLQLCDLKNSYTLSALDPLYCKTFAFECPVQFFGSLRPFHNHNVPCHMPCQRLIHSTALQGLAASCSNTMSICCHTDSGGRCG